MSRESPFKAGAARISSAVSSRRFAGGAAELADKNESGQSGGMEKGSRIEIQQE